MNVTYVSPDITFRRGEAEGAIRMLEGYRAFLDSPMPENRARIVKLQKFMSAFLSPSGGDTEELHTAKKLKKLILRGEIPIRLSEEDMSFLGELVVLELDGLIAHGTRMLPMHEVFLSGLLIAVKEEYHHHRIQREYP